jgi:hypothetical protein
VLSPEDDLCADQMTSVDPTVLYKAYFHSPIVSLIYGTAKPLSDQERTVVSKILNSATDRGYHCIRACWRMAYQSSLSCYPNAWLARLPLLWLALYSAIVSLWLVCYHTIQISEYRDMWLAIYYICEGFP